MSDPKQQIRPVIPTQVEKENISVEEKFQNTVLRPVIKLQHELILCCFAHYLTRKKVNFEEFGKDKRQAFIHKVLNSDLQLKKDLRSLIIGLFTLDEYKEYLSLTSQINKRINSIIQTRITTTYDKEKV
jgi:hypothetical protein